MSERYTIARITLDGDHFEILVNPDLALSYRTGKQIAVSQIMKADTVFTDAGKGLKAAEETLLNAFKTVDPLKIAETILRKGTLQLTTEQRRRLVVEKRKQLISFISRQAVDPKTNLPHPPMRIEQAMNQIHFSIDPFLDTEEQAKTIIKLLRPILPLKIEQISIEVQIPPEYVGRAYGTVKGFGVIKREQWRVDGSWIAVVEMPAGSYGTFLEKLGDSTRGNLIAKILK